MGEEEIWAGDVLGSQASRRTADNCQLYLSKALGEGGLVSAVG